MFNFFRKTITWGDNFQEFEEQFAIAKIEIFKYLMYTFKGHLEKEDFKKKIPDGINENVIAGAVLKYLLPIADYKESPNIEKLTMKDREMIEYNIPKWADHVMQGVEFANLVTDTLNMYGAYQGYAYFHQKGGVWVIETAEGKRVGNILEKYADKNRESPTPKSYSKEIKKWMRWSSAINENNYKEYFDF